MTLRLQMSDAPRVFIETHGCKLNQADTGLLSWQFKEAGFRLASADEPADVYVVNTCTVTHIADRKARHALRAARRRNPGAVIVATGCYAQRSPEELADLDEIDLVVGNTDKTRLVRLVMEWRGETPVPCAVGDDSETYSPRIARTRAMVKIQEGCDQVCAYCIVPRVRGRERSIPADEIVGEVNRYVALGYKEAVLTGTQLGSYGFDLPNSDLVRLVRHILLETDLVRLRVSSLQPQEIGPEFLSLWSNSRLCPHFHLPLQSGSDPVLKRMRRRYSARLYEETVAMIRARIPDASITTDVIVGFPGETDSDFRDTYALCERVGFASMHVFPYSKRPGTSAAHYGSQVAANIKSERVQSLLGLAEREAVRFREQFLGKERPVLWEETRGINGSTLWSGLTDNYIRVLGRSPEALANEVTLAKLTSQQDGLVHAEVVL